MTYQHYSDQLLDELAEARKLASWYALLANSFQQRVLAIDADGYEVFCGGEAKFYDSSEDDNGLPLETPELRAALEKALDQPGGEA